MKILACSFNSRINNRPYKSFPNKSFPKGKFSICHRHNTLLRIPLLIPSLISSLSSLVSKLLAILSKITLIPLTTITLAMLLFFPIYWPSSCCGQPLIEHSIETPPLSSGQPALDSKSADSAASSRAASSKKASNGKIAFIAQDTQDHIRNWELFLVNEDGTGLERLTNTPYDEATPAWSPARDQIVYAATDDKLHLMDLATRQTKILNTSALPGINVQPRFFPDGTKIIYSYCQYKELSNRKLAIYNLNSNTSSILLQQPSSQLFPSCSPDGARIIYCNLHCAVEWGHTIQELWCTNTVGNSARQVLMTDSFCLQPAWSPDGKKVAFISDKSGNFDIWILDWDSRKLQQVTDDPSIDKNPSWSPDGKKIAFISSRSGKMAIWIKNLTTGNLYKLDPFSTPDEGGEHQERECKDVSWY